MVQQLLKLCFFPMQYLTILQIPKGETVSMLHTEQNSPCCVVIRALYAHPIHIPRTAVPTLLPSPPSSRYIKVNMPVSASSNPAQQSRVQEQPPTTSTGLAKDTQALHPQTQPIQNSITNAPGLHVTTSSNNITHCSTVRGSSHSIHNCFPVFLDLCWDIETRLRQNLKLRMLSILPAPARPSSYIEQASTTETPHSV